MTRPREFAAGTALVVISLLVGLVLLELACRVVSGVHWLLRDSPPASASHDWSVYDPLLGFVPRPDSVTPEASFDHDGFRVTSGATPPNAGLVLATGDSFTAGAEVANDDAWPAILQQLIGVRVINAGVGAYGLDQTVLRTERLAAALAPTAVVVGFIADDIWRTEMRRLWRSRKPYFTVGTDGDLVLHNVPVPSAAVDASDAASPIQRLLGWSALVEFVMRRLVMFGDWNQWYTELFSDAVRALPAGSGEEVSCALMHRLARVDAPVLVVAQYEPMFWTGGPGHQAKQRRQSRMVLGCASAAGLATLDTFETLNEAVMRGGLRSLYLQEHHNAFGNRLVAQAIAKSLAAGGLLVRAPKQ